VLFLFAGAASSVFAAELSGWPTTSDPAEILNTLARDTTFEGFRIELGGAALRSAISFEDEIPSPLFTAPSESVANAAGNLTGVNAQQKVDADSTASEWDYLWRNASRIPITTIPEPTSASLLVGGAILFWARRTRKPGK
jgi:hypothetical protein